MVSPIAKRCYASENQNHLPTLRLRPSNDQTLRPATSSEVAPHRQPSSSGPRRTLRSSRTIPSPYKIPAPLPNVEASTPPPSPTISTASSNTSGSRSRGARYYKGVLERKHFLDTSPSVLRYSEEAVTCAWCRRDVHLDRRSEARYYLGFFKKHLETQLCRANREEVASTLLSLRTLMSSIASENTETTQFKV